MCGISVDNVEGMDQQQKKHQNNPEESTSQSSDGLFRDTLFSCGRSSFLPGPPRMDSDQHPAHVPTGTTEVLTFYPTWAELGNFLEYIKKIEAVGAHLNCGICKVIPPEGWTPRPRKGGDYSGMDRYRIKNPVREEMLIVPGATGIYLKNNQPYQKTMLVSAFRKKAAEMTKTHDFKNAPDPEAEYWANVESGMPIYGADSEGTLYEKDVKEFNMNKIGTMFDQMEPKIPGANTPNLYWGMAKATFAFHSEDMDLYSINYLHFGEPKFWYGIAEHHADSFENLMRQKYTGYTSDDCKAFMIHKNYVVHPDVLRNANIPFGTMIQRPNEFIITFPRGYHQGFNMGYNCAEAVNFASDRWIELGIKAKTCSCPVKRGFTLDMTKYMRKYRPHDFDNWYFKTHGIDRDQITDTEEIEFPVKLSLFDENRKYAYLQDPANSRKRVSTEKLEVVETKVARKSFEEDQDAEMTSSDAPEVNNTSYHGIFKSWFVQKYRTEYKEFPKPWTQIDANQNSSLITPISDATRNRNTRRQSVVPKRAQSVKKANDKVISKKMAKKAPEPETSSPTDADIDASLRMYEVQGCEPFEELLNDDTMSILESSSTMEEKEFPSAEHELNDLLMPKSQEVEKEVEVVSTMEHENTFDSEADTGVGTSEMNSLISENILDAEVHKDAPEMYDSSFFRGYGADNQGKSEASSQLAIPETSQLVSTNAKGVRTYFPRRTPNAGVLVKKMSIGPRTRIVIDISDDHLPSTSQLNVSVLNMNDYMDNQALDQDYSPIEPQSNNIYNNGVPAICGSAENDVDRVGNNREIRDAPYFRSPEPVRSSQRTPYYRSPRKQQSSSDDIIDDDMDFNENVTVNETTSISTPLELPSSSTLHQPQSLKDIVLRQMMNASRYRFN